MRLCFSPEMTGKAGGKFHKNLTSSDVLLTEVVSVFFRSAFPPFFGRAAVLQKKNQSERRSRLRTEQKTKVSKSKSTSENSKLRAGTKIQQQFPDLCETSPQRAVCLFPLKSETHSRESPNTASHVPLDPAEIRIFGDLSKRRTRQRFGVKS